MGSSTTTEESKNKYFSILKIDYMSSDESASDTSASEADDEGSQTDESSAPKRKMLLTKKLLWGSEHLEETLKNLDKKKPEEKVQKSVINVTKATGHRNCLSSSGSNRCSKVGSQNITVRGSVFEDDPLKFSKEQFIKEILKVTVTPFGFKIKQLMKRCKMGKKSKLFSN